MEGNYTAEDRAQWRPRSPSAAWVPPRTSPGSSRSSPQPPPVTSPARRWSSTAAPTHGVRATPRRRRGGESTIIDPRPHRAVRPENRRRTRGEQRRDEVRQLDQRSGRPHDGQPHRSTSSTGAANASSDRPALRSLAELDETVDLVVITVPAHRASRRPSTTPSRRAPPRSSASPPGSPNSALPERLCRIGSLSGSERPGACCSGRTASVCSTPAPRSRWPRTRSGRAGRAALAERQHGTRSQPDSWPPAGTGSPGSPRSGTRQTSAPPTSSSSCIEHDGTDLIAVYCEDFGDGRAFVAAATAAAGPGKPVLLLTVGGSEASIRGAQSHTGCADLRQRRHRRGLPGRGHLSRASPRQLADTAATLSSYGPAPVHRVGVIADGGGHAGVASDVVEASRTCGAGVRRRGQQRTCARCCRRRRGANPVDLAGAGRAGHHLVRLGPRRHARQSGRRLRSLTGYFGGYGDYGEEPFARGARRRRAMAESARTHTASRSSCTPCAPRARPRAFSPTPESRCSTRSRMPRAPSRCCTTPLAAAVARAGGPGRATRHLRRLLGCPRTVPHRGRRVPRLRGWFGRRRGALGRSRRRLPGGAQGDGPCCTSPTPVASHLALETGDRRTHRRVDADGGRR